MITVWATHPAQDPQRWIGDQVIHIIPGVGIQGEIVELSQITVRVDRLDRVDETAAIIENLLEEVPTERIR